MSDQPVGHRLHELFPVAHECRPTLRGVDKERGIVWTDFSPTGRRFASASVLTNIHLNWSEDGQKWWVWRGQKWEGPMTKEDALTIAGDAALAFFAAREASGGNP